MNKSRQKIYNKFGGKCYLCGDTLPEKGWHADHKEPVIRSLSDSTKMEKAHLDTEDNKFPACASCNINKHSMTLEQFRDSIKQFVQSLNLYSTQYKISKRYGLINETETPVVFYFETLKDKEK